MVDAANGKNGQDALTAGCRELGGVPGYYGVVWRGGEAVWQGGMRGKADDAITDARNQLADLEMAEAGQTPADVPWFMHCHRGANTMVGVFPTPIGTYVHSWRDDTVDVSFYPLDNAFEGGKPREVTRIGVYGNDAGKALISRDVFRDLHLRRRTDGAGSAKRGG